jgi:tRNA A37 threonylcarbamoyladenosine modification protein TsaB
LKKNKIQLHKAKLLIVNLGPGSYAGIRNILSCMKVLSMIKKIKLIGVSNHHLCKIIDKKQKGSNIMILNIEYQK